MNSYVVTDQRNTPASHRWFVRLDDVSMDVVAACPTQEAAEAARRLLSGECARELADATIDRLVAAKTGEATPMRKTCPKCRCTCDLQPPSYGTSVDGMTDDLLYLVRSLPSGHSLESTIRHAIARAVNAGRDSASSASRAAYNEGLANGYDQGKIVGAAKTGEGEPMRPTAYGCLPCYEDGLATGAAQERARIVTLLRAAEPWTLSSMLADRIERGEPGQ